MNSGEEIICNTENVYDMRRYCKEDKWTRLEENFFLELCINTYMSVGSKRKGEREGRNASKKFEREREREREREKKKKCSESEEQNAN